MQNPIPSLKDLAPPPTPKPASDYTLEEGRRIIQNATIKAIRAFEQVLDDTEATNSELLSAARAIIELGHGKNSDALRIHQEEEDAGRLVADLIANLRKPPVPSTDPPGDQPVLSSASSPDPL